VKFGRAVLGGSPRILVSIHDGLHDLTGLPGRSTTTDGIDVIAAPVTDEELAALASAPVVPEPDAWLPPIGHPPKNILCVGRNYADHVREISASIGTGPEIPTLPAVFTKPHTTLTGHRSTVSVDPAWSTSIDYEGELAVVIGRTCRNVPASEALDCVFGYSIVNDITARDRQRMHTQWFLGKSHDGFAPIGPFIVTADEIPDPQRLHLQTRVNGELRQDASTSDMIFPVAKIIETLTQVMTLEPGDIIATGTPSGVGQGFDPPRFLKSGDLVAVSVDGIGALEVLISLHARGVAADTAIADGEPPGT
jgi:2-keto-4-pentenoate hydratase/2-oxohepta-3-ene-1,7-dioic acid hydratase in catechol pathway